MGSCAPFPPRYMPHCIKVIRFPGKSRFVLYSRSAKIWHAAECCKTPCAGMGAVLGKNSSCGFFSGGKRTESPLVISVVGWVT